MNLKDIPKEIGPLKISRLHDCVVNKNRKLWDLWPLCGRFNEGSSQSEKLSFSFSGLNSRKANKHRMNLKKKQPSLGMERKFLLTLVYNTL